MEALKAKVEDMEISLSDARFELRARENLLVEIFYELGNLPTLSNNGPNISEVLGVKTCKFDERERPVVIMELEWTKRFENYICVLIEIKNDSDFPGFVKCAVGRFETDDIASGFSNLKYFLLPDNYETGSQSYINSKRLRQLLIAIPIQFFQILNQNCTLFIDWVNLSSEILPELKCAPQIHARIDTKFSQKFASLNYSFNISSPLNGWPSAKYLESALERDAINILHCLCLTRHQKSIKHSSADLHSMFEFSINEHFKITDFGAWQMLFGLDSSIWSDIFVYIAPEDDSERFLPKYSIIFASNNLEVHNFDNFLNCKLS